MLEIGVFHNGASSLPVIITKDGVAVNDGSLAEVHDAAQEVLVNQVRQGILAEKLGFQSFWLTEHHFQPEGAEMSPNPLFTQMAIAAQTKRIRLGQCGQYRCLASSRAHRRTDRAARCDQRRTRRMRHGPRLSAARERDAWAARTAQRSRTRSVTASPSRRPSPYPAECWTEPSFSHHGENFSIPPTYTKWNHKQTIAYFQMDKVERRLEDVIAHR